MKSNCLFYALQKFIGDGGYLVIRFTYWNKWKYFKWPHFLWKPEKCIDKNNICPYINDNYENSSYLVISVVRGDYFKWLSFKWLPNKCPDKNKPCPYFLSYSPKGEKIIRIIPPPLFDGEVHSGDEEKPEN